MLRQIALGISISLVNFAIHSFLVAGVVVAARRAVHATIRLPAPRRLVMVTGAAAAVLLLGHIAEVGVWAAFYAIADVAPPAADAFYFAFVNYTTLGYGDVVPSAEWRLIGPITAMNGVLLFGWSTAVLFDVIRTTGETLRRRSPGGD
jgi:type IV secretory pathway TrbD component